MKKINESSIHLQKVILKNIISNIKNAYTANLTSIAIYGSYTSNTSRLNSDNDLFIILEKTR